MFLSCSKTLKNQTYTGNDTQEDVQNFLIRSGIIDKLEVDSQAYFISTESGLLMETYSLGDGTIIQTIDLDNPLHIWERRSNLKGRLFRVGYFVYNPDTYAGHCTDKECPTGFTINFLAILQQKMNFTVQFHLNSGFAGRPDPNTGKLDIHIVFAFK